MDPGERVPICPILVPTKAEPPPEYKSTWTPVRLPKSPGSGVTPVSVSPAPAVVNA